MIIDEKRIQAQDLIVFYKKTIVNNKIKYVADSVAYADYDGRILTEDHKGKFLSEYKEISPYRNGYGLEIIGPKINNIEISYLGEEGKLPEYIYYKISFDNLKKFKPIDKWVEKNRSQKFKLLKYVLEELLSIEIIRTPDQTNGLLSTSPYRAVFHTYKTINYEEIVDKLDKAGVLPKGLLAISIEISNKTSKVTLEEKKDYNSKIEKHPKISPPQKKESQPENQRITTNKLLEITNHTKLKYVGQETAVQELAYNIYLNYQLLSNKDNQSVARNKSKILLDGPTGTGKTAILKSISAEMSIPIIVTGANDYTTVGYQGADLTDILIELLNQSNGDLELAQKGVVCLDEFDKLASPNSQNNQRDSIFKKGIQNELLKFIEGNIYEINYKNNLVKFDTSKLTVIMMGAFTDLRENKINNNQSQNKIRQIGFAREQDDMQNPEKNEENSYTINIDDYIEFGLSRELIGRINTFVSTKQYTVDDLKKILKNSTISPLKEFVEFVQENGITLKFDDSFIQAYAEEAHKLNTGARALETIRNNLRNMLLEKIIFSEKEEIELTVEMLEQLKQKEIRRY